MPPPDVPLPQRPAPTPILPPVQTCTTCTIISETFALSPTNRARTRLGVGEIVELYVSPMPATWAITSGTGALSPSSGSRSSISFTADDSPGSVTITATGPGCTCTITFTVVEPSGWTMKRAAGTVLKHTAGRPDCGWLGSAFIHPNDVNFYRIEIREKDSQTRGSGCFNNFTGLWHGHYPPPDRVSPWRRVSGHTLADGSVVGVADQIYVSAPEAAGAAPPFTVGELHTPIAWQWHVVGFAKAHDFNVTNHEQQIFADGRTEARKGGHTESCKYNDPPGAPF